MFIQPGKVVRFFPADAYYVTKGSELKGHGSSWEEVGLAKPQLGVFLETSEVLPADDPRTLGNVHNCTMAGSLVFSYHLLFKHTAKQNHLSQVFTAGREEFSSVNCDKIWKHTLTTAAARATSSRPCKSANQEIITYLDTITCIIFIFRFLSYRLRSQTSNSGLQWLNR